MKKEPKVGEKIYVGSSYYINRGSDDFEGGIATISRVEYSKTLPIDHFNYTMIGIEERPNTMYNYKSLLEKQEELNSRFGDQIAHPDPDDRVEFNDENEGWH